MHKKIRGVTYKNVFYHKILALAFINNGPYELIEHLDDDKLNNDISNLKFSNKRDNGKRAFNNGNHVRIPSVFEICIEDGTPEGKVYKDTVKEIAKESGVAEGTVYDHICYPNKVVTNRTKYIFRYIYELEVGNQRAVHQGLAERKFPKYVLNPPPKL